MTAKPEIETLSSRLIYESEWTKLRQDEVRFPGGSVGTFDTIQRRNFVGILALDDQGDICLVEQFRYGIGARLIEIPMGGIEARLQESVESAALRELREETGFRAANIVHMGSLPTNAGYMRQQFDVFFASGLTKGPQALDAGEEGLTVLCVPVAEMERMIKDGLIINEHTIAAFCLARLRGLI